MIVLRFLHVVSGALWVGMFGFMTFFLMPVFAEGGPEGAKLQAALAKRRIPVIMPVIALVTLLSGSGCISACRAGRSARCSRRRWVWPSGWEAWRRCSHL